MERNIILSGVGGQGILSIAYCLCNAALKRGLSFKQAEVHGMAQRGGGVHSHLRFSANTIYSDLVPLGQADLLLSVEPVEALRHVQYLRPEGTLVSSSTPFVNIPDYPDVNDVLRRIGRFADHILVDSQAIARMAGSGRADNMIMLGAASASIGFALDEFDEYVEQMFGRKSARIVEINCRALRLGRLAADCYVQHRNAGCAPAEALRRANASDLKAMLDANWRADHPIGTAR